jgi:hypothetical protein
MKEDPMPTQSDVDRAFAQVGYNVLETIGRAFGTFGFGINPVALGAAIGGLTGGSSPWKHRELGQDTHQN